MRLVMLIGLCALTKVLPALLGLSGLSTELSAQRKGTLLVVADVACTLTIDGREEQEVAANEPARFSLREGEHLVQARAAEGTAEQSERIVITPGQQSLLELVFNVRTLAPVLLAELSLNIPGSLSAPAESPELYYALAAGDVLSLSLAPITTQGTNQLKVLAYPDGSVVYTAEGITALDNHRISIPQEGIYRLVWSTPHSFDRKVNLRVSRIPASAQTMDYHTRVVKKRRYEVVSVQEPSMHWLNSYSNAYLRGGSDQLVIPINLPANTVEWYYTVSASRDREEIASNLKTISLARDIAKAVLSSNPAVVALNFSFNLITQPPGSDYCDVFLMDKTNQGLFTQKETFKPILEGTRENITSAKVKMSQNRSGSLYLGLRNRDTFNGMAVGIEVAAVVASTYWERE